MSIFNASMSSKHVVSSAHLFKLDIVIQKPALVTAGAFFSLLICVVNSGTDGPCGS